MATTIEKVYKLEVQGTDSLNELKSAIEQLNDKLKTLNETSKEYKETLAQLTDYQSKLADAMKGISDSTQTTNESLSGIKDTVDGVADSISKLGDAVGEDVLDAFTDGLAQGMAEAAQEAVNLKDNVEQIGGASSVKELKQEISDLRDRLVTLDSGSDEYKATVQQLIDAQVKLKEVMNAGKNEMQAAEGSYNALSQRMSALKQVWKETTDEATRNEIGQQINEINNQLKALDASIGNSQRNVGNYKSALEGLDESFVGWKEELRQCKEAMQQLDPASQAYNDAMMRAAEITHQLSEQQEQIKYASTDVGDQLENVRGIASNMAAGFSAVNAAMGLFGQENEDVQKAMLKVQQAMALVQGLQGLDGFIKRTKGLSQSMGLATKATKAQTTALKADAAASKQDAVAKGAEATATAGVIPAQLGLNAAMKANPIGFIIGLIASLIAIFSLLKDKIMEMIGSNKEMSAAFDKVKAVLAGFGNIIKKSVINPIKMAIIPIKTLAKVMIDLFKGDWSKIGDDIKEGFTEMKDTAIDSINVVGQFKEGFDKKIAEQNEAARKAEAEARSKDKDNYIKDMEAKYGADWKYTEEGKKAYEEYYKALAEMYDQDSEEYRQALRDKEAYLRDFNEKQIENSENMAALELKLDIARYGEEVKYSKKWYDYEKKLYQDAMKLGEKYRPPYANIEPMPPEVEQKIMEAQLRWETYLKGRNEYYKKHNDEFKKETDKLVSDFKSKFDSLVDDRWKALRSTYETVEALTKKIRKGGEDYEAIELYLKEWEKMFKAIGTYDDKQIKSFLESIRKDIENKSIINSWDNYIKAMRTSLDKTLYDMDKSTQTFVNDLELRFEEKKLMFGIQFPEDEIDRITEVFNTKMDNANFKAAEVRERIDFLYETLAAQFSATTEQELAAVLPGFRKLLEEEQNYCDEVTRLNNEMTQKISDVRKKAYEKDIKELQKAYDSAATLSNLNEQRMSAEAELLSEKWGFVTDAFVNNSVQQFNRGEQEINEYYDGLVKHYNDLIVLYEGMANNEELTAEERAEAHKKVEEYKTEITKANINRRIELEKNEENAIKKWKQQFKDLVSTTAEALGNIADYYQGVMDLEKMKIDQDLESKKIDEKLAAERYAAMEEEYKKVQGFQAAQTIINGLSAAISAYQSLASIPYVGPFLGAAAAAAAIAASVVNAKKIMSTEMDKPYGGGGGNSSSTNFQLPDVMEYEPQLGRNETNMSDTDELNNDGSGRGRGETRVYVVESDISSALDKSNKRKTEVTF